MIRATTGATAFCVASAGALVWMSAIFANADIPSTGRQQDSPQQAE